MTVYANGVAAQLESDGTVRVTFMEKKREFDCRYGVGALDTYEPVAEVILAQSTAALLLQAMQHISSQVLNAQLRSAEGAGIQRANQEWIGDKDGSPENRPSKDL